MDALILGMPITQGTSQQALEVMTLVGRIYENEHNVSDVLHEKLQIVGGDPKGSRAGPIGSAG